MIQIFFEKACVTTRQPTRLLVERVRRSTRQILHVRTKGRSSVDFFDII